MAKTTGIEWAEATWNPWMGCAKVSPGCKHCYMFRDQLRYGRDPAVVRRSKTTFEDPLKWERGTRIFTCSWSDFFIEQADGWRADAMDIIQRTPHHTYLILTKRPERVLGCTRAQWWVDNPHAWLGVSVETQTYVHRLSALYNIPAAVTFLSAEPLLGPLDLSEHIGFVDWVITGGESDPNDPRPCDLDWVRDIRDKCQEHGVAFFHKQHGGRRKINGAWGGRQLDGRTWDEFPEQVTIR